MNEGNIKPGVLQCGVDTQVQAQNGTDAEALMRKNNRKCATIQAQNNGIDAHGTVQALMPMVQFKPSIDAHGTVQAQNNGIDAHGTHGCNNANASVASAPTSSSPGRWHLMPVILMPIIIMHNTCLDAPVQAQNNGVDANGQGIGKLKVWGDGYPVAPALDAPLQAAPLLRRLDPLNARGGVRVQHGLPLRCIAEGE